MTTNGFDCIRKKFQFSIFTIFFCDAIWSRVDSFQGGFFTLTGINLILAVVGIDFVEHLGTLFFNRLESALITSVYARRKSLFLSPEVKLSLILQLRLLGLEFDSPALSFYHSSGVWHTGWQWVKWSSEHSFVTELELVSTTCWADGHLDPGQDLGDSAITPFGEQLITILVDEHPTSRQLIEPSINLSLVDWTFNQVVDNVLWSVHRLPQTF